MTDDRPTAPTAHKRRQSVRTAELRSPAPDCQDSVVEEKNATRLRPCCCGHCVEGQLPLLPTRLALTIPEAAAAVGVSERLLRGLLSEIPHVRLGGRVVVPIESFREWLADRVQQERGAVDRAVDEVLDGLGSRGIS